MDWVRCVLVLQKELAEQEVVVLPESGTLVFPLCQGDYVLGLLVVERDAPGRRGGPKSRRGQQTGAAGAPQAGEGLGTAYTAEEEASARPIVRSVALACAMEQRSALMRVERAARRQWVRGLVEQTRGPLVSEPRCVLCAGLGRGTGDSGGPLVASAAHVPC